MNKPFTLNFRAAALSLFITLVVSYIICIAGDLLFGWTMYTAWAPLLPGFTWPLTFVGFIIGLLWLVGYSVFAAILFVYPYNYFVNQQTPSST
jgi:hypothetical protein